MMVLRGLRPATLFKKDWHRCFPVNFVKFVRTLFHIEHLRTTASNIILQYFFSTTKTHQIILHIFFDTYRQRKKFLSHKDMEIAVSYVFYYLKAQCYLLTFSVEKIKQFNKYFNKQRSKSHISDLFNVYASPNE